MTTPLQEACFELSVELMSLAINVSTIPTILQHHILGLAIEAGSTADKTFGAKDKMAFISGLHELNVLMRKTHYVLRVLDMFNLANAGLLADVAGNAEQVHRLVVAALRTAGKSG